ncbi:MAG: Gfo/Idh/MocA family oxidoreductase [Candidatus Latescibacterota bacterium]|nr:Gfo/Idh/MocA family oxidoreductase [Candidatus Latescibacterota bacterium]
MNPSPEFPVRCGIVGAGGIAATLHLPQIAELEGAEIRVISGRRSSRLEHLSRQFEVGRMTSSYAEVVEADDVDAVIVATPHPLHVEWGIRALEAGKHVLMQKPLCADMSEAHAFVAVLEDYPDRVALCLPFFPPAITVAQSLCLEGAIGRVSGGRCRTSHGGPEIYYAGVREAFAEDPDDNAHLWFFDSEQASVGALFDMGVYAVASLVAIMGTARAVSARVTTFDKPTQLEDVATVLIEFEGGALATAETSWCDPARTWELSVHGTAGKLTSPGIAGAQLTKWTPTSYTDEHASVQTTALDCPAGTANAHSYFLECIAEGKQPVLSHAWAARHVTEILLAGLQSSGSGETVALTTRAERDANA